MPRRKSRWKIVLVIVAVIVAIVIVASLMHGSSGKRGGRSRMGGGGHKAPVPVTVVPVEQKDVPIYLTANGTVRALDNVTVQPQVTGRLLSIDFKEGQQVKKGDVLARIDPRTYKATYDQDVARTRSDQAQLTTARGNLSRSKELVKKNYISQQDLKTQINKVKQLEATVAADKANAESARIDLDYTKIRAPITGLTGIRQVDPGNVVNTSSNIVTLTHVHPIDVAFSLPAKDLDQVRTAQANGPLPVAAIEHHGKQVLASDGHLQVINNQIDPDSGTFTLKARFPNKQTELWPGQFVNVRVQVATVEHGLVIPTQAVERGPDGDYVYMLQDDDTVKMQPITIAGDVGDTHQLVSEGVAAGDKVVTEGQFRLKPGSKVRPLKPGEVPAAEASASGKPGSGVAAAGSTRAVQAPAATSANPATSSSATR